ncbi:DinB family protein [Salegentibacter sp. JZCK2]|uniref:DinB family protein n=1 Tax=Salegentibacter tibetensis TaxID=2873600 RepID=UPI001CCD19C4|nr:DinB family protein [Salegentibacter tibetensis]MBZ9731307.1 DinB family protein [Salegentibacter tibetensis]
MSNSAQREQLIKHLKGGEAFMPLEHFIDDIPFEKLGERPQNLPYSFYELSYHIVFAQKDILEFSIYEDYKTSKWPDDYWPKESAPQTEEAWEKLKKNYFDDRDTLKNFILDVDNDLNHPVKNSEEHTLLREILLVVEHTAYHTGQMLIILRLLGLYK